VSRPVVGGLDGCRAGWVLATIRGDTTSEVEVELVSRFDDALARVVGGELSALAVDMPIGLPDGPRAADDEARRRLGARRATVFPTPVRAVLGATDHVDALARSRRACGRGLSVQAFHLLPKMAEVDRCMSPALQDRVFECHPELAFAHLAGRVLASSKRALDGRRERIALLARALGTASTVTDLVDRPPRGAKPDDVADALAIALVARRFVRADVERLGDGRVDRRGLRMEIVV
jgi:predicted RNase H-like nuclease